MSRNISRVSRPINMQGVPPEVRSNEDGAKFAKAIEARVKRLTRHPAETALDLATGVRGKGCVQERRG